MKNSFFRPLAIAALALAQTALADGPALRASAELVFKHPDMLRPGACVAYREGGSGWIVTEPVYYVKGTVIAAETVTRPMGVCPTVPGKEVEQYSREEFLRLVTAQPCVSLEEEIKETQVGIVRFRAEDWETPHGRRMVNAGRLYRGMFNEHKLAKGLEIELEADLLGLCEP